MTNNSVPATEPKEPRRPTGALRVVVGLLAGVGATGITAGLGVIGTLIEIDPPLVDPSPLILMAPVAGIPGFAGAVLGGRAAVTSITAGAVGAPIVVMFAIDGSCPSNLFAGIALASLALFALVIGGLTALAGSAIGVSQGSRLHRGRGAAVLVGLGGLGMCGWIAALAVLFAC